MADDKGSQLNLTVVALVSLVAIVGLVALVMNAAGVKTTRLATGSELAEAQSADDGNLAGDAGRGGGARYMEPPTPSPGAIGTAKDTPGNRLICTQYGLMLNYADLACLRLALNHGMESKAYSDCMDNFLKGVSNYYPCEKLCGPYYEAASGC